MDYRKMGNTVYIRMDKGDEIVSCVLEARKNENIQSAIFSGIERKFIPETGTGFWDFESM